MRYGGIVAGALALALGGAAPAAAQPAVPALAPAGLLSIDMLYADRSIIGTSPEGYAWSRDGAKLAFLWNDHGEGFRDIWIAAADGAKRQLTHLGDDVRGQGHAGVTQAVWLADGRIAFVAGGVLSVVDAAGQVTAWEPDRHGVSQIALSGSGDRLAFRAAGGLWVKDVAGAAPARLIVPGADKIAVESFRWNARGDRLAFVQTDDRAVRQVEIDYDAGGTTHHDTVTRAFPGDPHLQIVKIGVIAAEGGAPHWFARLNDQDPVWDYGLSDDGSRLFVSTSDFRIKHHYIYTYDVASGQRATFYSFADPIQIRPDWQVAWAPGDKGLILLSNRDGYNHLYSLPAAGAAPRQITRGPWEIESFTVDAKRRMLYFTSDQAAFQERQAYRVPIAGGAVERLTSAPGTHAPVYSPDFGHVADRFSDDLTPPELYVAPVAAHATFARVTHSPLPAFAQQRWATVRYVDFQSHVDGAPLTARLMLPADYRPGRLYPVIVGSVYSDAVHNQWGGRVAHATWGLDQFLVDHGYVVINPGIRGSFGRGKEWNRPMNESYGNLDIDDIQDSARYLIDRGIADPKRIGLWGSSYGGLMTTMSLFTKPGFYAAGIAGAPATNVGHAFPEQEWIAGAPDGPSQPALYQKESPLYHSDGLADPLMIIHGTRDQVVLYADTIALAQRLIAKEKMFELVTVPGSNHPWDMENLVQTRFTYKKIVDFFDRHLMPQAAH
ncbi:prolyl oligopeptidase family serine peptidase [Sphingomonas nostoxanthinifaciens]|uniref:prolyl oligopeptidase family serine peptidase n=1 Tax=Sphingomonas nostoxanthinifaciens TaxID=2872652 RepID=UPI001CC1D266|nr:prolyl oligopeptidase family serine peptidase [Sphingomonas nostoxanthinifaciens]UAK25131.1 prolyl oligopeptidase family serine peptidase [Sphingomonas nostoxanthinifaciens]